MTRITWSDEALAPTMRLDTAPGSWVRFTGGGGYDMESAHAMLIKGEEYKVESIETGCWSSVVYLKNVHGAFNTVMFENVT